MGGAALSLQVAVALAPVSYSGTPGSAVCRAWLETGFGTTSAAQRPVSAVVQVDTGKEFLSCGLHAPIQMGCISFVRRRGSSGSAMHLVSGLCDHASLIPAAGELVFRGLAAAVATGDRRRAVGRAAGDLVQLHLARKAIIQSHHCHAEMQEVGDNGK